MSDKSQSQQKPEQSEEDMARQRREAREAAAANPGQQTEPQQGTEQRSNKTSQ